MPFPCMPASSNDRYRQDNFFFPDMLESAPIGSGRFCYGPTLNSTRFSVGLTKLFKVVEYFLISFVHNNAECTVKS